VTTPDDEGTSGVIIRAAREDDLAGIVALFAADDVGEHGDSSEAAALADYRAAFARIAASANDRLYVAELDGAVAGTFQTTLITGISGRGATNMNVEGVQTRADLRGQGIGEAMMRFAIARAQETGCRQVQLTSNMARTAAHRFYARLGFTQSHAGFKMKL